MTSAGQFGPYPFIDSRGNALPGVEIAIYDSTGTTLAALYSDRARTPLANPLPTGVADGIAGVDTAGNAIFWADADEYLMVVRYGGTQRYQAPITISADPDDANAVLSVNGRSGIVIGLAENADLVAEAATARANEGANAAAIATEASTRATQDGLLIPLTQRGAANGVATLDAGSKVPTAQLPALAITETFPVASQAAMLALTAQRGDVAIRTDLNKSFILSTDSPGTLADWKELLTPTDSVTSVNARVGVVSGLAEADASNVAASAAAWRTAIAAQEAGTYLEPGDIGSTVQAYDADLAAIAALSTTAFGRSLLAASNALAARLIMGTGGVITPEQYGCVGDGVTDDYANWMTFVAAVNTAGGGFVELARGANYYLGQYVISAGGSANGITDPSFNNCTGLVFDGNGATITVKGDFNRSLDSGGSTSYERTVVPLRFSGCTNLTVKDVIADGNVDLMTKDPAVSEGAGLGLAIYGCSRVVLQNIETHHFHTDGVYFSGVAGTPIIPSRQVVAENIYSHHNGRQGMSVVYLRTGRFINCRFENTGNTGAYGFHAPGAGVDIEPNSVIVGTQTGDLVFDGGGMRDNYGAQFIVTSAYRTTDVTLRNLEIIQGIGSSIYTLSLAANENIVENCQIDCFSSTQNLAAVYPHGSGSGQDISTIIRNTTIRGNHRCVSGTISNPDRLTIEDCELISDATTVSASYFPYLDSMANTRIVRCRVFLPAAAHNGLGAHLIAKMSNLREVSHITWETDLAVGGQTFYPSLTGTLEVANLLFPNAGFQPAASGTWDPTLLYASRPVLTVEDDASTARTLLFGDENKLLRFTSASAVTVTIPTNTTAPIPVGTRIYGVQAAAGQVTIAAAGGVTLNGTPALTTRAQNSAFTLVKTGANRWLAFGDMSVVDSSLLVTITSQSGTTYTLALADAGTEVETSNASAVTVTIPTNASVAFPVGTFLNVRQIGAGQVTIAAAGGVTLRSPGGAKTRVQYASVSLTKRGTDEWVVAGDATT